MDQKFISLIIWLTLILASLLSGCQAQPEETVLPSPISGAAFTTSPIPVSETQSTMPPSEIVPTAPPGCTAISPKPTPGPTEASLFPPVRADEWIKGPLDASVTFVEYGDFQ